MSTSPNKNVQRRKNAKSKSNHPNDRDQLMNSTANERLQSDRENNKHHQRSGGGAGERPAAAATIAALNIIQARAHSLCNGGGLITPFINCCRDVNCCCLNANSCHSCQTANTCHVIPTTTITNAATVAAVTPVNDLSRSRSGSSSRVEAISEPVKEKSREPSQSREKLIEANGIETSTPATDTEDKRFILTVDLDLFSWLLFALAFATRFYRLTYPRNVVFDELHYAKSVAHYMRNQFFFDTHPPLGKQLIAAVADSIGYDGNFTATNIGSSYQATFPLFWMRFLPALCGSLLPSAVYNLIKETGISRWASVLGGLMVLFDNSMLIQSRLILMESMLLLFCTLGLYFLMRFQKTKVMYIGWILNGLASATFLTFAFSVKYVGFFTYCLAIYLIVKYLWDLLYDATKTNTYIILQTVGNIIIFTIVPIAVYLLIFYMHLTTLYKAGPHDAILTSAFQASLEGGLASITQNQPLKVAHGSQITLRHTHGALCWLHSHALVYPVRYPDGRGSSHQQQVTCYPFKDVNNWWIVKKPKYDDIVVGEKPQYIRHGDIIQLVHGITSRALNSHDVAAPITPTCQEVSCYIDYGIDMKPELLWKVDITNRHKEGSIWKTIKSEVRLIHVSTGAALKYTNKVLPDWAYSQQEVAADRDTNGKDVIWNVEEHRYTRDSDRAERERKLMTAEMIPMEPTKLSFINKFLELQYKMLVHDTQVGNHMYSSDPLDWPLLSKGIAYWVSDKSNAQIHLLGNILIWYTCTLGIIVYFGLFIFYLLRRQRLCYDIDENEWNRLLTVGHIYFIGYLIHYIPYFTMDTTLFLHNYMPAFLYKVQLLCFVVDHIEYLLRRFYGSSKWIVNSYRLAVLTWFVAVISVYIRFLPISYGWKPLTIQDILDLRWKDTWDFVIHATIKHRVP
ncbi:protein O-mannosyltransferase 1 [Musca vetustissima]|uniref:protein O-mannosyltransferase 1 n=1 Tax=Musca vetustissima TaxID=27455 RepID=UPI002AB68C34|nr:protein O-mannosyltransferase 1 [Musca vetustissima]